MVFTNKTNPLNSPRHGKWQIISKVFSSVPLTELSHEERQDDLPFAVGEPVRGVLEYYRGGHLSRPDAWIGPEDGWNWETDGKEEGNSSIGGDDGISCEVTDAWVSEGCLFLGGWDSMIHASRDAC